MKQNAPCFGKAHLPRLGLHIRDVRRASGRSQADIARLAGIAESTVGAVEAGRSNPSLPTMIALANALGVTIDQIVTAATTPRTHVSVTRASGQGGDLSAGLSDPALRARAIVLRQGQRLTQVPDLGPDAAVMVLVLDGVVMATTASGERLELEAGDTVHSRDGALCDLSGLGADPAHLICVTDPRRRLQGE